MDLNGLRLPDFFIVGCQKSGTTWLHNCLREHNKIFMPASDEVHFFDTKFPLGLQRYGALFKDASNEQVVGEATSSYSRDNNAIRRIARILPDSKLIIVLRNPIERTLSHYWHERKKGRINYQFSEIFENYDLYSSWVLTSNYSTHLHRLSEFFPKNKICTIVQEEMKQDPLRELKKVFQFLGVDDAFIPKNYDKLINVSPNVSSVTGEERSSVMPTAQVMKVLEAHFSEEKGCVEKWLGRPVPSWSLDQKSNQKLESEKHKYNFIYLHGISENSANERGFDVISQRTADKLLYWAAKKEIFDSPTITFDDGLRSSLPLIKELNDRNYSTLVFINTGYLTAEHVPYEPIIWEGLHSQDHNMRFRVEIAKVGANRVYEALRRQIKFKSHNDRLSQLIDWGFKDLAMNFNIENYFFQEQEVAELAQLKNVTIGSHMHSHVPITVFSNDELTYDATKAREHLADLVSADINNVSVPYGDVDQASAKLLRSCGYEEIFGTENCPDHDKANIILRSHVKNVLGH